MSVNVGERVSVALVVICVTVFRNVSAHVLYFNADTLKLTFFSFICFSSTCATRLHILQYIAVCFLDEVIIGQTGHIALATM